MTHQRFSRRHGFAPQQESLPYNEVPPWVREEFLNLLQRVAEERSTQRYSAGQFASDFYDRLRPYIWKVLDKRPPNSPVGGPWAYYIPDVINRCEWWQFYDICEEVYALVEKKYGDEARVFNMERGEYGPEVAEVFGQEVNGLFSQEGLPWRFRAYPITPAARKVIQAQAKCSIVK